MPQTFQRFICFLVRILSWTFLPILPWIHWSVMWGRVELLLLQMLLLLLLLLLPWAILCLVCFCCFLWRLSWSLCANEFMNWSLEHAHKHTNSHNHKNCKFLTMRPAVRCSTVLYLDELCRSLALDMTGWLFAKGFSPKRTIQHLHYLHCSKALFKVKKAHAHTI